MAYYIIFEKGFRRLCVKNFNHVSEIYVATIELVLWCQRQK